MSIDFSELRSLPVTDKLRIVTQLWDDIAASKEPIVLPPEQLYEAARRAEEMRDDPTIGIDENELWRRVDG
jgi:putative addiction module component (TIGR02574 family)